jgi:hypothetical protein
MEHMDAANAEALWSNSNDDVFQWRIISESGYSSLKRCLKIIGSTTVLNHVMIAINFIKVALRHNCKKYPYWYCDLAEVVSTEPAKLLNYTDPNLTLSNSVGTAELKEAINRNHFQCQRAEQPWVEENF